MNNLNNRKISSRDYGVTQKMSFQGKYGWLDVLHQKQSEKPVFKW